MSHQIATIRDHLTCLGGWRELDPVDSVPVAGRNLLLLLLLLTSLQFIESGPCIISRSSPLPWHPRRWRLQGSIGGDAGENCLWVPCRRGAKEIEYLDEIVGIEVSRIGALNQT